MFKFLKRSESQHGEEAFQAAGAALADHGEAREAAEARPRAAGGNFGAPEAESRRLNLVNRDLLLRAIDQAVRRGVGSKIPSIEPELLDKVVFGTRNELVRLLKESSRSVRGLPKAAFLREVEEDRQRILAERERVQAELEQLLEQLASRKEETRSIEAQLVWESRQSGIQQDEQLTSRIFEMFGGMDATHEQAAIREQVTFLLLKALNDEREKVVEAQMAEHRREVENFERRITKLTHSLELTEEELQRIAKAKGIDPGVASIYRSVQGLGSGADNYEVKLEMMASIFQANLALQKGVAAEAAPAS